MIDRLSIKKNILDLEHNELLSKATTSMSMGIGSLPLTFFSFSFQEASQLVSIGVSVIFSVMFISLSMSKFEECKRKREEIKALTDAQLNQD